MSRSVKRDIYHAGNGLSSGPAIRRHDVTVRFGWFSIPPEVYEVRNRLVVKGARQNNLRDVSVELPKDALIVFTGVSGSVKSGLAYDTIFAEGQRRYVDSLSSSARQFLGQLDKPDVDAVEGMSPAIAIDQKTSSRNPRSTVGTITEVNDHLRPLYARIGHPHCPECGEPTDTAAHRRPAADEDEGTRFHVLAPVVRDRNGEHAEVFRRLSADGFSRVRVDGAVLAPATRPLWTSAGSARSMWSWTGRP
ncbi:hypothetical protein [Streptomyces sp. NPDC005752]|uniref:hypothetical protein n=1 Tax=Streptomyces sp. NPDC005752 TaxID=3157065 RepID=UPI0033FBC169